MRRGEVWRTVGRGRNAIMAVGEREGEKRRWEVDTWALTFLINLLTDFSR